ncbi:hypothetical protein NE237_011235 [Protea cynaroides]|uniref:Uncharacterized protein n=1 Tax=Protea cynaroides TaxID=273540 RepID=A0A9Q0JWT5_9MAGN|nr:hypothetical protein NE237_011235 [Protea cynaroides]
MPRQLSSSSANANYLKFLKEDFFEWQPTELFDLIFDYTFFCAIEPPMRPAWARRVRDLLKPDGQLITLMFPVNINPFFFYEELLCPLGFEAISIMDNELAVGHRKVFALFKFVLLRLCSFFFPFADQVGKSMCQWEQQRGFGFIILEDSRIETGHAHDHELALGQTHDHGLALEQTHGHDSEHENELASVQIKDSEFESQGFDQNLELTVGKNQEIAVEPAHQEMVVPTRGKEWIMAAVHGSLEEEYRLLPQYCEQAKRTNPGSIASVFGNPTDNCFQRSLCFLMLLISSINLWLRECVPTTSRA